MPLGLVELEPTFGLEIGPYGVAWGLAKLRPMFGPEIGPYDVPWGLAKLGPQVGPKIGPYDVPWHNIEMGQSPIVQNLQPNLLVQLYCGIYHGNKLLSKGEFYHDFPINNNEWS